MLAVYARIFTDDRGISCFEDLEIELTPGFATPPAEPLHTAQFLAGDGGIFWIGAPTDWKGAAPHPAPRRMIFITVRGEYQVTTSDNVVRRFPVGSVLIVEDTTGSGHSTEITSAEDVVVFAVGLPAA
jgi:hypothetical protein